MPRARKFAVSVCNECQLCTLVACTGPELREGDTVHRPDGRLRGIFSLAQIARQLGVDLQPTNFAHTFAEIEVALRD